jgi:quercetin 2,3-dioxygenase
MIDRYVVKQVTGYRTKDGAGVSLVRVLGGRTVDEFDPILLLDSFDSINPQDYIAGFPLHPHRGIETISYVYQGKMTHKDSLGNEDTIGDGEVQWMTAGSGIMHEERLPAAKRMLGVQLWLNLAAKDKMTHPAYLAIKNDQIKDLDYQWGKLRLLAGRYDNHQGYLSKHLPLNYYDLQILAKQAVTIPTAIDDSVMIFTLLGEVEIGGILIKEKTAVKLSPGDVLTISTTTKSAQVLFIGSRMLGESIAWGGPIVMNTREELQQAFDDLDNGTFLKDSISY